MLIILDNLAKRYKRLPTEVLEEATTFDLHVSEVAVRYTNYLQEKANGNDSMTISTGIENPTEQEMLDMIRKVKQ